MIDIHSNQLDSFGCLVTAGTPEGQAWLDEHLSEDCTLWAGGVVVEPRYIDDILIGAYADGLTIGINGEQVYPTSLEDELRRASPAKPEGRSGVVQ